MTVNMSGRSYETFFAACSEWGVGPDQGDNWLGSGKAGGLEVSPLGERLLLCEEVRRVGQLLAVARDSGARQAGCYLTVAYENGERVPPDRELWPTPLVGAVLGLTARRVEQLGQEGHLMSGMAIGNTTYYPQASVVSYLENPRALERAGPVLHILASYGLSLELKQVHGGPQVLGHDV